MPKPEPYVGPVPSATPPKEMAVFALVTGVTLRFGAFGFRGRSLFERRDFSMAGALPAHDMRAFAEMPRLSQPNGETRDTPAHFSPNP